MTGKKAAIIGSGNIGTDLLMKMHHRAEPVLEAAAMIGIDSESDGLTRARNLGVWTTHEGLMGLVNTPLMDSIDIFFDATSAKAHLKHASILADLGKRVVDLTPAAVGPYTVPVVNLDEHVDAPNVNMVTCGGQATIPIVAAVGRVSKVHYGEIVASISSRSAGPGTRANIDEFTRTTALGIEKVGGASRGKAIIVLNPADPPVLMRNTVYTLCDSDDEASVRASIESMVEQVAQYVPGYRLVQPPIFEDLSDSPVRIPEIGTIGGLKVTCLLEVKGAGDYLPEYAGNLDIMTSAALRMGELIAERS